MLARHGLDAAAAAAAAMITNVKCRKTICSPRPLDVPHTASRPSTPVGPRHCRVLASTYIPYLLGRVHVLALSMNAATSTTTITNMDINGGMPGMPGGMPDMPVNVPIDDPNADTEW
jgi:hypothetical protein